MGQVKKNSAGGTMLARTETANGYNYKIDSLGRTTDLEVPKLHMNLDQGRNVAMQLKAGGADRLADDQGGHFVARIFDGPLQDYNHFAQNGNFNQGIYKTTESGWRQLIEDGHDVALKIHADYPEGSLRPSKIIIQQWIDGEKGETLRFGNNVGGKL
jgi:hypothetical protein